MGFFLGSRLSVFVIVAVAGFVAYDINKYGSFRASKTGVFLRDCGVLRYGELALTRFRSYSQQAYRWSQKHVPGYMSFMRESLAVYLIIIRDVVTRLATHLWANISQIWHYFVDKKPAVVKWFKNGRPSVHDDQRSGRPSIVKIENSTLHKDRTLTVDELPVIFPQIFKSLLHNIVIETLENWKMPEFFPSKRDKERRHIFCTCWEIGLTYFTKHIVVSTVLNVLTSNRSHFREEELGCTAGSQCNQHRSKSNGLVDNVIAESRRPFSWCVALLYFRVLPLHFYKHKN
ncbi:hypothetical protein J6590_081817 [Homalodisca vitripennis]|nr:hypothetical protein J6590_081817 [Homalodisca vitripennis]